MSPGTGGLCFYRNRQGFQHRITEDMSYTERVIPKINMLCISVALYLCVENTFESASLLLQVSPGLLFFDEFLDLHFHIVTVV